MIYENLWEYGKNFIQNKKLKKNKGQLLQAKKTTAAVPHSILTHVHVLR